MSKYEAQYGYPLADLSVYPGTVHILPPKEDGPTRGPNGIPQHTHDYALSKSTVIEHSDKIEDDSLRERVERSNDLTKDILRDVAEHFAHDLENVPCNTCGKLIWIDQWAGYYARNKCKECDGKCSNCGADLDETRTVTSTSRSVRKGTRYKCDPEDGGCGRTWEGIVTG